MKFSASTNNLQMIEHVKNVCLVMSKLSDFVIFKISKDSLGLMADPNYHDFVAGASCRWNKDNFQDYTFNGLNERHNKIYFRVQNGSLISCFSKVKNNEPYTKMNFRLVNVDDGFGLRVVFQLPDSSGTRTFKETLHIRIIKYSDWKNYEDYNLVDVDVSIEIYHISIFNIFHSYFLFFILF